ncbi:recombinase family protein [Pantoea sp. ME81]|uniref:recombinase family protein n=1 Tax=Pantoea sp. ME81 TaxID=2743935 RepID=UPI0015F36779|nr:recombinase family protein [Pantoea sp. ME81]
MKIPVLYLRVSSKDQALNGGGLHDQEQAGMAYIKSMPNHFNESQLEVIRDEGISSYRGSNIEEGAPLYEFVQERIRNKDGNKYSIIAYSIDRISRMNVWASSQFVGQAIMSGIEIHDLMTRQVLKSDDQIGAIISTLNLMRANSESDAKSKRKLQSIENNIKRSLETGKAYRAKCPKWLRIENEQYVIVDEIADCLRDAVDWYLDGWTSGQIVKELNHKKRYYGDIEWSAAFLVKTLKSKTLIGTWTRVKDGQAIEYEDFYPAIVDKKKHKLMVDIITNIGSKYLPKHRVDKGRVVNILSGMITCSSCGSVIHINRARQDQKYFYCSSSYGRKTCSAKKGNFLSLEKALLTHLKGFDLNSIINAPDNHERKVVETELIEARGILADVEVSIQNRKSSGKLVLAEMLEALGDSKDKVQELETKLAREFTKVHVPDVATYKIEEIVLDTHIERGKLHREIGTIVQNVRVGRQLNVSYMIITYKNDAKHVVSFENKTGTVITAVYMEDDVLEVYGSIDQYVGEVVLGTDRMKDGYQRLKVNA